MGMKVKREVKLALTAIVAVVILIWGINFLKAKALFDRNNVFYGIYSLSPYTLEEVVSRNYLITERPDAILNIVDGTNLERNLYLTTQLTELGIPVVVAINMMDVVKKNEIGRAHV